MLRTIGKIAHSWIIIILAGYHHVFMAHGRIIGESMRVRIPTTVTKVKATNESKAIVNDDNFLCTYFSI